MSIKEKTISFFDNLSFDTISIVDDFYSADAVFIDPLVKLNGSDKIKNYYAKLYEAVIEISFDYGNLVQEDTKLTMEWVMHLRATGIKSGQLISVPGISIIKFNETEKVEYHRDYYDLGEFVYEHIPILNKVIAFIKEKLAH